jgi:hypothetical protein
MLTYIGAFVWGFVLLVAFGGYGKVLCRLLRLRRCDDGLEIAWGLAFLIVAGGVLNLAWVISPRVIVGIVLVGVGAWFAIGGLRRLRKGVRNLSLWDVATIGALLLGYINWLCFNQPRPGPDAKPGQYAIFLSDDSAYTVAPVQMLQTGGTAVDPFADRLTSSGLGGESFLQALVLAVFPVEYIHLADPGLAFLGMGALFLTSRRLKGVLRFALVLLFASYPSAGINASAAVMPIFLLVALARILHQARSVGAIGLSLVAATLVAAILTLKSNLISVVVLFVFFWGVCLALMSRRFRPIALGAAVGLLAFVMVLPYMIRSYQSCKTLLYPFLGEGYRKHTLVSYPYRTAFANSARAPVSERAWSAVAKPQTILVLAGCAAALWCTRPRQASAGLRAVVLACCFGGIVNLGMLVFVCESGDFWRYSYAVRNFMAVVCYGTLLGLASRGAIPTPLRTGVYLLIGGSILFYGPKAVLNSRELPDVLGGVATGRMRFTPAERERYRRMQASIPAGCPVLWFGGWPLFLDHARNSIYFPDNIGSVSPSPGIPLTGRPDDLVRYLRGVGVKYVVSPSVRECERLRRLSVAGMEKMVGKVVQNLWSYSVTRNEVRAYKLFGELAMRYPLLYDDGEFVVIALDKR